MRKKRFSCFPKKKGRGKKVFTILAVIFIFVSCFYGRFDITVGFVPNVAYADVGQSELEQQLGQEVQTQISDLDFSEIEEVLQNLSTSAKDLFSSGSFVDKLNLVITGQYAENSQNFFSSVFGVLFSGLKKCLPVIGSIIAVSILGGMVQNLKPVNNGKSIGNIVHFVTYGMVIVFLGTSLLQLVKATTSTLTIIKQMFDGIFPILLTLLTAVGGSVSVGIYQPAIALLSNAIIGLITYVLLPIFVFALVFSIVGNLSNNVQLDKFVSFLQSIFKWTIGLCFTIFLGFVSIQGVMAGAVDNLSIRTAKYTIKSYVPIVGGYVSDGLSIILASSMLIKNAVGGVGLFLLFATVISPLLDLVVFMMVLKFMAGIIQPIGDKKIANFLSDISKSLSLLVALLVAVSFMYVVMTGLVMCSANLV